MWFITESGNLHGYAYQCPKCEYKTLNYQQYYCPNDNIQLDEVRIGDDSEYQYRVPPTKTN